LLAGYDAHELTGGDATLRLEFGRSHGERRSVETPYDAVDLAVPTTAAYLERFSAAVTERRDGTHFNADG
jgi:hypothetical protein